MKVKNRNRNVIVGMMALVWLLGGAPARVDAALLFADFQGDTPGTAPGVAGNVQQNGTTTIVTTTDSASDPFGVPGNQSMRLHDQDGTGTGYRATLAIGTLPATSTDVSIEMDLIYTAPVGNWTVTNLIIGDSVGATLPWFPNANAVQVFPALTSGGIGSVGQLGGYYSQGAAGGGGTVITQNVPFHLKIVTDSATSSYNVFVDGVPIGWDFGGGTVFDIPTAGTNAINMMTFTSEGLGVPSMGDVFVDNIVVTSVPEPATCVLLFTCFGCMAFLRRRPKVFLV